MNWQILFPAFGPLGLVAPRLAMPKLERSPLFHAFENKFQDSDLSRASASNNLFMKRQWTVLDLQTKLQKSNSPMQHGLYITCPNIY